MKMKIMESMEIPSGVTCQVENHILKCSKASISISRSVKFPNVAVSVSGNVLKFESEYGNKNQLKFIMSSIAHVKNLFNGLDKKFTYKLQACNVHFPMTLKVEKDKLIINNFLGEKKPRFAKILPNVVVEVKGVNITIVSHDKESAGQTAANMEKATKIRNRDRRIFQDGIYITEKGVSE